MGANLQPRHKGTPVKVGDVLVNMPLLETAREYTYVNGRWATRKIEGPQPLSAEVRSYPDRYGGDKIALMFRGTAVLTVDPDDIDNIICLLQAARSAVNTVAGIDMSDMSPELRDSYRKMFAAQKEHGV